MSNEYKDWLADCAQDFLLEQYYLKRCEWYKEWKHGWLICGRDHSNRLTIFYVYLDDALEFHAVEQFV